MKTRIQLLAATTLLVLGGCESDGDGSAMLTPGVDGSYLFVSVPEFYFGTVDVGNTQTQQIELANRGGDIYPIRKLELAGDDVEQFSTDFYDEIILEPAQVMKVDVSFTPITSGRKYARLDIDFDTIKQVSEQANQNEQVYYRARELEDQHEYGAAHVLYSDYIAAGPAVDVNREKAKTKAPMMRESTVYGAGDSFRRYVDAINARELGDIDRANTLLDEILDNDSESYINDDALYLRGYIALMDSKDYALAESSMRQLRREYPDSSYIDSAIYSEGIAADALGHDEAAQLLFETLRDRNAGFKALGIELPKDNLVSRVWHERASKALEAIAAR